MNILNANFNFILNEIKDFSVDKLKLRSVLKDFPDFQEQNGALFFRGATDAVAIAPGQITYVYSGKLNNIDIQYIASILKDVNDLLEFEEVGRVELKMEGTDFVEQNSLQQSLNKFSVIQDDLPTYIKGVGQRFIVNTEDYEGDLFLEPYIRNENNIFLRAQLLTYDVKNITEISKSISGMLDIFQTDLVKLSKKMYK
ncbi:hypothetical protein [Halalkalibacter krulwichiae]|uniref:Uncharacterized protein n=1 Tax=Halalkalibacter krulwichiae TaxID=199441 RepID=A0A1X9M5U6_9BACI|nr:hypothetical protein [Halalkalibacter krulwichiae]ARK28817.1 hypothetical protein BkAM31D_02535 [Halalkalibacter krulwichiae]